MDHVDGSGFLPRDGALDLTELSSSCTSLTLQTPIGTIVQTHVQGRVDVVCGEECLQSEHGHGSDRDRNGPVAGSQRVALQARTWCSRAHAAYGTLVGTSGKNISFARGTCLSKMLPCMYLRKMGGVVTGDHFTPKGGILHTCAALPVCWIRVLTLVLCLAAASAAPRDAHGKTNACQFNTTPASPHPIRA